MKDYLKKCKIEVLNVTSEKIEDEEYFKIPATSISKLKKLDPWMGGSPEKYLEQYQPSYNPSLLLGTCVHYNILQPDEYTIANYTYKPSGKLGVFIEFVYKYRQEGLSIEESLDKARKEIDYYSNKYSHKQFLKDLKTGLQYYMDLTHKTFANNEIVMPNKLLYDYQKCVASIKRNSDIQKVLLPNVFEDKKFLNEIALFADIKVTLPEGTECIIKFKSKLDSVVIDPEKKIIYLSDVKTTSKGIKYWEDTPQQDGKIRCGTFTKMGYHIQMAAYGYMLQKFCYETLNMEDYNMLCNMWVVETNGEYSSRSFPVNMHYINKGWVQFEGLLARLAWHEINGFDKEFKYE